MIAPSKIRIVSNGWTAKDIHIYDENGVELFLAISSIDINISHHDLITATIVLLAPEIEILVEKPEVVNE